MSTYTCSINYEMRLATFLPANIVAWACHIPIHTHTCIGCAIDRHRIRMRRRHKAATTSEKGGSLASLSTSLPKKMVTKEKRNAKKPATHTNTKHTKMKEAEKINKSSDAALRCRYT